MTGHDLIAIATPFITILFLLLVGAGLRRWGLVTLDGARQMTGLVLNVSLPPLIFVTMATEITPRELRQVPQLLAMGAVGPFVGYAVSAALGRASFAARGRRATFQAASALMNTTFIGYPVCAALLGKTGLLYAALYDAGFTAVMSTFSIWLMSREGGGSGGRDLVRSPMMWGVVLGVAWGGLDWPTPDWLIRPLSTLGQATTPLALLAVGMLVQLPRKRPDPVESPWPGPGEEGAAGLRRPLALVALVRLVAAPALIWGLVALLRVERTAATVMVLQTAMPTAVCTTAMAEQYGGDSAFAAAGVVATTALSLLTLPLWSGVLAGVSLP